MTVVDTSDWQRGTVAPQKLIGNFGAASNPERVTLPANAETLWVFCVGVVGMILQSVVGVTTGKPYPFAAMPLLFGAGANPIYVVPVSSAADMQVTITWAAAPAQWYVVADAGVRLVIDQVLQAILATAGLASPGVGLEMLGTDGTNARVIATDKIGRQYGIPGVPATDTGDGPPYELKYYAGVLNAGAGVTIIAAPGAGKRIRIFYAKCRTFSGSASTVAATFGGVVMILVASGTTASSSDLDTLIVPLTGIATDANTPVVYTSSAGNPGLIAVVIYTVETI